MVVNTIYDDAKIQRTQIKAVPIFCLSTSHIFLSILSIQKFHPSWIILSQNTSLYEKLSHMTKIA